MNPKKLFCFITHFFLLESITGYCIESSWPTNLPATEGLCWAAQGYASDTPIIMASPYTTASIGAYDLAAFPSSYGGGFAISSASPISPYGVSLISDNAIEGILAAVGEVPFLSTVVLEGVLPSAGVGAISYGCGNGNVAMINDNILPMAATNLYGWPSSALNYGPVTSEYGYTTAWASPTIEYGYECNRMY